MYKDTWIGILKRNWKDLKCSPRDQLKTQQNHIPDTIIKNRVNNGL